MRKSLLFFLFFFLSFLLGTQSVKAAPPQCGIGETPFVPGGGCESTVNYIQRRIGSYPLTCQDTPTVKINRTQNTEPDPGPTPVTVKEDLGSIELGGLGPSGQAYNTYSSDVQSQYYPFMGLFDKPLNQANNPREASRTYWRFLSSYEQANAKATFLSKFNQPENPNPPINDDAIVFYSPYPPPGATPQVSPTPAPPGSDDTYGFNWGYGHINPGACADANGRAVTFLVGLTAQQSELQDFKNCYKGASKLIVRITNFDGSTDPSVFRTAGAVFQQVFGNDYIELGNELNNLSSEYTNCGSDLGSCGGRYAQQFAKFRESFTGPNISAAALDTSNSDYDAAAFLAGAINAYKSATFISANSYDLGSCKYDPQRCSKDSYNWLANQIGAKNIILTEYGLAPGNDNDLTKVIDFYKNNKPGGNVIAVTPLIRNPCSGAVGQWLRMINYKFYDVENSEVNPQTCAAGSSHTLYPDSISYSELITRLHDCLKKVPVCDNYLEEYANLDPRTKSAYDALFPLDFDAVRGYQVLNGQIARENLPYVQALEQGLMNEDYGLLNGLSPQWLIDRRTKEIADNKLNNINQGKVPLALESALDSAVVAAAGGDAGDCGSHHGIYLPSPNTHTSGTLSQTVNVPYSVSIEHHYKTDPLTGLEIDNPKYHLTGSTQGQAVTVLNNPLLAIIELVVNSGKNTLVNMFLPSSDQKPKVEKDMVAPIAYLSSPDDGIKVVTDTLGVGRSVVGRVAGQTHTALCVLRNKWLLPKSMQDKSLNCDTMMYQQMIEQYYVADDESGSNPGGFTGVPCKVIQPSEAASCPYVKQYPPPDQFYIYSNLASCRPEDRASRGTSENKTYTICCPSVESLNNVYANRSAVCGNAAEINPACGYSKGVFFCWGNNYREGDTDSAFPPKAEGSRKGYWEALPVPDCFKYNGVQYCPNVGEIHVCDSNVIYCGAH